MPEIRDLEIFLMQHIHRIICARFDINAKYDNLPLAGVYGTREDLAELFVEFGYKKGAEIGVSEGFYSEILCKTNPDLELLCIDPWEPTFKITPRKVRRLEKEARERLAPYKATLIKDYSLKVVRDIPDKSLDFVYIDANHEFDSVMMDIINWTTKVRPGGIIAGHDFCHSKYGGVVFAVEAYTRAHRIDPWYVTRCDREPSWFWVVQ